MPGNKKPRKKYVPRRLSVNPYVFDGPHFRKEMEEAMADNALFLEARLPQGKATRRDIENARKLMNTAAVVINSRGHLWNGSDLALTRIDKGMDALAEIIKREAKGNVEGHFYGYPKEVEALLLGHDAAVEVTRIALEEAPRLYFMESVASDLLVSEAEYRKRLGNTDEIKKIVRRTVRNELSKSELRAADRIYRDRRSLDARRV